MPPQGGRKRKQPDRRFSEDDNTFGDRDGSRPSPHRPGDLNLAQHRQQGQQQPQYDYNREYGNQGMRGGRRGGRGGRGGLPQSPNQSGFPPRQQVQLPKPSSPPPAPLQNSQPSPDLAVTKTPAPLITTSTQTPTLPPATYMYEFLTEEVVSQWSASGRTSVVSVGLKARQDGDSVQLGILFQEILRAGLDQRIAAEDVGSVVRSLVEEDHTDEETNRAIPGRDAASQFLDGLSILAEGEVQSSKLQSILMSSGISPLVIRDELDVDVLVQLGLIRDTFARMAIRRSTNLLYRQSNYNLLREETEGYSKLITELFTTSGNEPPTSEVVEDTFEKVKAMIGTFDMDVGRVLDVTFDVFAAVLVKQYRFFVKLLRMSSWWPQAEVSASRLVKDVGSSGLPYWALPDVSAFTVPDGEEREELALKRSERDVVFWDRVRKVGIRAFFEIGRRPADVNAVAEEAPQLPEDGLEIDEDRKWIKLTGTLPPPGNKVAAQILGFKLRFYSSGAREVSDELPKNLIFLAALLIKIGFISLRDLYPHLWPADVDMESVKEQKMKERLEREKLNRPGGGALNALMTAGALADDTLPPPPRLREVDGNRGLPPKVDPTSEKDIVTPVQEVKSELPEPEDQKVQLLKSLLCIGALPESLYLLGSFPWLVDAFPDLPEYIHRILHHSLSKVYEPLRPLQSNDQLGEPHQIVDPDQSGVSKGSIRWVDPPARKTLRWAKLEKNDTNEGTDNRFYWDDWSDNVPICQTVDDVFSLCNTLLNYSGVKIGQDPLLLAKLTRIGVFSLDQDPSDNNRTRWMDLSKRLLVPALSLTRQNSSIVSEVYDLIKQFPTTVRYSIYAEWYSGQISRLPDIKSAFDQTRAETKDVLKRISKTNVKSMARNLAKVATSSPGIVFNVAISQIESYDNLVEVVVECARYFTYLGYDVLTWSLLSSLGARGRNRVQADGMLTSKWLLALSLFAGKVFKRYSVMNPTPILQYVTDQLRQGNSTDLIVLEEITSSMAGLASDTDFNDAQVVAMAGGKILQSQTMLQLLDKRHESALTAKRLMKSLVEPRLAGKLLISIAQERQICVFKIAEPDAHTKLLGNLFDETHRVLTQYLDLLRSNLSIKEFDSLVPSVSKLIKEFGVEPGIAFWISRPSIAAEMAAHKRLADEVGERKESPPSKPLDVANSEDVEMSDEDSKANDKPEDILEKDGPADSLMNEADTLTPNSVTSGEAAILADAPRSDVLVETTTSPSSPDQPWHPVLSPIMAAVRSALSPSVWEILSESFFVTFWQLSLGDMLVPTNSYEDENNRQKRKIQAITSDRSDVSIAGTQKKDREKKIVTDLQDQLRAELKDQVTAYTQTRARLGKEKEFWFAGCWGEWDRLNVALLEHCFFPRIVISPIDAVYAFKMLKFLHGSGTKNLRTMGLVDQFFNSKRLTAIIFQCTNKEAENIGRFLNELLKDLGRWHADKSVYEKEAYGSKKDLPGFSTKMTSEKTVATFLDYEDFRRILQKWHANLNTALKACFSGGEYMHIRNAISILRAIYLEFPVINWMGKMQLDSVTELSRTDPREDLKLATMSLLGNLKRREKDWVLPQAFSLSKAASGANGLKGSSTKASTPQPDGMTGKSLNANAPEFTPRDEVSTSGNLQPASTDGAGGDGEDGEDGEIEDARSNPLVKLQELGNSSDTANEKKSTEDQDDANNADVTEPVDSVVDTPLQPAVDEPSITETTPAAHPPIATNPTKLTKPDLKTLPNQTALPPRPSRSENSGNSSESFSNHRQPQFLPNRPEVIAAPLRNNDASFQDRHGPRDNRDNRLPDQGRYDRLGDPNRERLPDRSSGFPRSHDRPFERGFYNDHDRQAPNWGGDRSNTNRSAVVDDRHGAIPNRDTRLPPSHDDRQDRSSRDRPYNEPLETRRHTELQGRKSRESSMGPPRSGNALPSERTQDQDRDRDLQAERRTELTKQEAHSLPNSQRGSRTGSPTRREENWSSRQDHRRDDRAVSDNRRPPPEDALIIQPKYDDSRPPTGPRTDRVEMASNGPIDRFRDSIRAPTSNAMPADFNRGRLYHDANRQESQYGRLNAEPPSGPRLPNGNQQPATRTTRSSAAPPPTSANSQIPPTNTPAQPSNIPDRPAPTGPASDRGQARNSMPYNRPPPVSGSTPSTPVSETPLASIHPDRLRSLGSSASVTANPSNASIPQSPTTGQSPSSSAPKGISGTQPNSATIQPRMNNGPPTGPSFAPADRTRGDSRGDKRFVGLNTMLQQADRTGQGTSIRGRASRTNNVPPTSNAAGPPLPPSGRQDYPPSHHDSLPPATANRSELFPGRGNSGHNTPTRVEEANTREGPQYDGPERRSMRHRENRSASPGRRDLAQSAGPPLTSREDTRGQTSRTDDRPPRREEAMRDQRTRAGGQAPSNMERDGRESRDNGVPRDRDHDRDLRNGRSGPPDIRRDEAWGTEHPGSGGRPRDDRDRERDRGRGRQEDGNVGGSLRKRTRPEDGAYVDGKRGRRI